MHLLLGRVVSLFVAIVFGPVGDGAIWMMMLEKVMLSVQVVVIVLFLVHCSLFKELSSGCHSCFKRLMMGCILGLTIFVLFGIRHVGRLLDGKAASRPTKLVKDGDLLLLIERMLRFQGLDTG